MKRSARLQSARHWLPSYRGKNIVRGYSKWYGVDLLCAIIELRLLGISVCADYEEQIRANVKARTEQKARQRARKREEATQPNFIWGRDYDDNFAFIAGYTSGGAPFGITWEQQEEFDRQDAHEIDE